MGTESSGSSALQRILNSTGKSAFFHTLIPAIVILVSSHIPSFCQINWTLRNPLPTASLLKSVAWNGSQYVAVGDSGTILISPDAVTWTACSSGTRNYLSSVCWTGTRFLATGENDTLLVSTDGNSWTIQNIGIETALAMIAPTAFGLTGVGLSGTIVVSTDDGDTWDACSAGTNTTLAAITSSDSLVIAVGKYGTILSSTDGTQWTQQTSATRALLYSIKWTGTQFIAIGDSGVVLTSENGTKWTRYSIPTKKPMYDIAVTESLFVAVGDQGILLTSPDLKNWNGVPGLRPILSSVIHTNGMLVVTGDNGAVLTSDDAVTWTNRTSVIPGHLYSVTSNGSTLIAVGSTNDSIIMSRDGKTWTTQQLVPKNSFREMTWTGNRFIGIGGAGVIFSENGTDWQLIDHKIEDVKGNLLSVIGFGDRVIATGTYGRIQTLSDDSIWTLGNSHTSSTYRYKTLLWTGHYAVAGGSADVMSSSDSGINWRSRAGIQMNSMVWTGSIILAVGNGGEIHTSADEGMNWTSYSTEEKDSLMSVTWSGTQFVAVGTRGVVLYSRDGKTWTRTTIGRTVSMQSVTWTGTQFVAVGKNGIIFTSPEEEPNAANFTPDIHPLRHLSGIEVKSSGYKQITIVSGTYKPVRIRIFTSAGTLIHDQRSAADMHSLRVPSSGWYLVEVTANEHILRRGCIVSR